MKFLNKSYLQEAYLYLENNPSAERRLHCLQSFVTTLCDEKELETLCSLPYASSLTLERNGRQASSTKSHACKELQVFAQDVMSCRDLINPGCSFKESVHICIEDPWREEPHSGLMK